MTPFHPKMCLAIRVLATKWDPRAPGLIWLLPASWHILICCEGGFELDLEDRVCLEQCRLTWSIFGLYVLDPGERFPNSVFAEGLCSFKTVLKVVALVTR